jgi:hypothetical protein
MARVAIEVGLWVDYDDQAFSVAVPAAVKSARGTGGAGLFDETPTLINGPATAEPEYGGARALADAFMRRGLVNRVSSTVAVGAGPQAVSDRRPAPVPAQPTQLTVALAEGEQAVVLVEGDGVLAWRYGSDAAASALVVAKRGASQTKRALVFDLGIPPIAAPSAELAIDSKRGWLRDRLIDGVKAIVLYFAAETAVNGVVTLLERSKRDGPVVIKSADDLTQWRKVEHLREVALPADRPARVLLLVHGTFSSTLGGYGELAVTPWGQRLLTAALQRYDAVLGFDHRTLSLSPRENAQALLDALRTLPTGQPIVFDAVCHSRGGYVLRSLIEQLLPGTDLPMHFERAIFVAATNRGTELARPDNWESLVDLVTNLCAVTSKVLAMFPAVAIAAPITDEVVDSVGDFVKYLVEVAVKERHAPGIAAMDPSGEFVRDINLVQAGQPTAKDLACYAIVSDFYAKLFDNGEHEPKEMPKRLALLLADGVVDRLMRGEGGKAVPNDLVVDVASMTEIDPAVGGYVRDVLDFGRNPLVYHTNYFLRPETVGRIAQWLRLPSPLEGIDLLRLAGGQTEGLIPVPTTASVAEVRTLIEREAPKYLVLERKHQFASPRRLLHYAITPQEFLDKTERADPSMPAELALALQENHRSLPREASSVPFDRDTSAYRAGLQQPAHAEREVVLCGDRVDAVLDRNSTAASTLALSVLAGNLHHAHQIDRVIVAAPQPPLIDIPSLSEVLDRIGFESSGVLAHARLGGGGGPNMTTKRHDTPPTPSFGVRPAQRTETKLMQTFANAEMPRESALGLKSTVTVTLSAEQIELTAGVAGATGEFAAQGPITVQVMPRRGFDYAPDEASDVTVAPPKLKQPILLDFQLLANEVGPAEVTVAFRQGNLRLLTLTLRSTVVANKAVPVRSTATAYGAVAPRADCGTCATLEIMDRRNDGQLQFEYFLSAGDVHNKFSSAVLKTEPRAYVDARYDEIEKAWTGNERAVQRFVLKLQAMGGAMFRQLFPVELQRALWRLAQSGQLDDILVHSDEPFLPWEVVFLDDPDAPAATGQGRFFGELGMCRWLWGAEPACAIHVREGRVRYVIPHYPGNVRLEAAEQVEQPMLEVELHAIALTPSHAEVVDALSKPGSFDLLHFACHGAAQSTDIDSAALLLEGELLQTPQGQTWGKEMLLAAVVDQVSNLRGADGNRPLVVVNACQTGRLGYSLTGLGGFAPAFLGAREGRADSSSRAGAFVGTLWSVGDSAASTFVVELYRELKAGKTMSQATRAARSKASESGEGTWLAYAVYAHPHLRITFS